MPKLQSTQYSTVAAMNQNDSGVLRQTTITEKVFKFSQGACSYRNSEVNTKNCQDQDLYEIKINNNLCAKKGSSLVKMTEITFGGRCFVIQDVYDFKGFDGLNIKEAQKSLTSTSCENEGSRQQPTQLSRKNKKKLIFKKRFLNGKYNRMSMDKRNTKNIAKNFIKAFLCFLSDTGETQAIGVFRSFNLAGKYNNQTIEAVGQDAKLKMLFIEFLQKKADSWISSSKIQDKAIHYQAVRLYLELLNLEKSQIQNNLEPNAESQDYFESSPNDIPMNN